MKYYKDLNKTQFETLAEIAFGGNGSFRHPKTLKVLVDKNLIEEYEKPIYGKGNTPIDKIPMMIKAYYMPIAEHIEFCSWCAEYPELDNVNDS